MADSSDEREPSRSPGLGSGRCLAPGSRLLDRFTIERKLGEGGVGRVFAAFDEVRNARVALKTLIRPSPGSLAQFEHEFRIASAVAHPNLIRLHEFFGDGPEWFFTMDLVEGDTLPELQRRGFAEAELDRVFAELARAIAALHREGILHGDLKP